MREGEESLGLDFVWCLEFLGDLRCFFGVSAMDVRTV